MTRDAHRFAVLPTGPAGWIRAAAVALSPIVAVAIGIGCMVTMPGKSHQGALPGLTGEQRVLRDRLEAHVRALAVEIGERNISCAAAELDAAARYVERALKDLGFAVASQRFTVDGHTVRNLEAILAGSSRADEIVVVGAHYDSAPGTPAANDNGSGVAGLLELARLMRGAKPDRQVRFVAFVNEELPYFQTDDMGSVRYARRCRERGEDVVAMLSLETIGYYTDEPQSQQYPPLLGSFYPDTGDFIAFVGNVGSRCLVRQCAEAFRRSTAFPCEGAALPGWLTGVGWSDHWAFWEQGFDAVMVTDTAVFRYPYYHESDDTPDKIDFERTARVVAGLHKVILALAAGD